MDEPALEGPRSAHAAPPPARTAPPLGLVALFLASRLFVLLGYDTYLTDMPIYADAAFRGLTLGQRAYCDFEFVYPPAALGLVYLPGLFASSPPAYASAFRLQMFAVDALCFAALWLVLARRLAADARAARHAALLYCALGPLVGHLLYDRLDLALALVFAAFLFLQTGTPRQRRAGWLVLAGGILVKVVPLFLLPVAAALEGARAGAGRGARWLRSAAAPPAVAGGLAAAAFALYAAGACDAVFGSLARHGARGIEVGSFWASPLLLHAALVPGSPIGLEVEMSAWQVTGAPTAYVRLAQWGMAAALALYGGAALAWAAAHRGRSAAGGVERAALFVTATLLLTIVSARVLSPQYLIWLLPLAPVLLALPGRARPVLAGSLAVFGLTFVAFDLGFFRILKLEPAFVIALALRNLALAACAAVVVRWSLAPPRAGEPG